MTQKRSRIILNLMLICLIGQAVITGFSVFQIQTHSEGMQRLHERCLQQTNEKFEDILC